MRDKGGATIHSNTSTLPKYAQHALKRLDVLMNTYITVLEPAIRCSGHSLCAVLLLFFVCCMCNMCMLSIGMCVFCRQT